MTVVCPHYFVGSSFSQHLPTPPPASFLKTEPYPKVLRSPKGEAACIQQEELLREHHSHSQEVGWGSFGFLVDDFYHHFRGDGCKLLMVLARGDTK